ncbi:MAG: 2Fe-2S iron-sulfur cluster-binding protein [Pseudomonadota bacterium]|nr:2Fe-2S iron-sulfur cluster-binding protein [Pseudomonadota bacterium]
MPDRLPPQPLEWIDRNAGITLKVEGKIVNGFAGDTITSALLASGECLVGRSFKYHRRRGPLSLANHDINALFEDGTATNIRGDVTPAADGMDLRPTNVSGTLARDRWQILGRMAPFLPVGFYYKAFHTPKALFPFWERCIRNLAGLGRVNTDAPMTRIAKRYLHTDVLVVGGGPAGMAAALAAADRGVQVTLVDENPHLGGSLDYQHVNDPAAAAQRKDLKSRISEAPGIKVITGGEASANYADHWVPVTMSDGIVKIRSRTTVFATGVFEQPAVFHNNDLPGVLLASAAQRLIARYAVKPCNKAVVLTANPEGYRAAQDLLEAGVEIAAIADTGDSSERGPLVDDARKRGIPIHDRCMVYEATSTGGRLDGVVLATADAAGKPDMTMPRRIDCSGLMMSVGWAPAAAHLYQAGGDMRYDEDVGQIVPAGLPDGIFAAGRVNGVFNLGDQLADGAYAGRQAAAYASSATPDNGERPPRAQRSHSHPYPVVAHPNGWNFVDFDEDLTLKDLERAADEGFDNIELLKRYSTIGMGPSQGKHANMNGIRILARKMGRTIDETGSTTARPFFHPVPMSKLAGRRLRPHRHTPLQEFHETRDAVLMEAGIWSRPEYYGTGRDRKTAIEEEVRSVRENVGIIDVSTLGKIEVVGPDAAELMDRLYTMRMSNVKVGMSRYALMVDESGVITDDGVAVRRAEDHFYVTTTSGTSDSAFREIQRRLIEWQLNVEVVNRTGQLGGVNVAGPRSRSLLAELTEINLDEEVFPYLGARAGRFAGGDALLIRVGFVGELGFEIHMAPNELRTAVNRIMTVGAKFGLRPFGVEAQRLLRLEKGHIIVGQDTDGLTNPYEAAMHWAIHTKKDFFIGKRSLEILKAKKRRSLVGFTLVNQMKTPELKECSLVINVDEIAGRVTSIAFSPTLGHLIGMAYVDDQVLEQGNGFCIRASDGRLVDAVVARLPFIDPEGLRQKVTGGEKAE